MANSLRIFRHLLVKIIKACIVNSVDCIHGANTQATTTAYALGNINGSLTVSNRRCTVSANIYATTATDTFFSINLGMTVVVHFHFACTRTAAHTNIFNSTTKACHFVTFEVSERDKYVRIHNGATNLRFFYQFAIMYGHISFISTLQAVCNNYVATGAKRSEAIFISTVDMFKRFFTTTNIQSVAIGKEGLATQFFNHINYCFSKIRTQVRNVTGFAKMNFNSGKLLFKIDIANASLFNQLL